MKTLIVGVVAGLALAGAAAAQEQTVAAGRIQNTFDASGRSTTTATSTPAAASAPDARAEPAIRAIIGGLQTGTVDWSAFTPNLAAQMQPGEAQAAELIRSLGALESVEWFQGRDGVDLFLVRFDKADTQWVIGFEDDGKIAALLFRPAPPIAAGAETGGN